MRKSGATARSFVPGSVAIDLYRSGGLTAPSVIRLFIYNYASRVEQSYCLIVQLQIPFRKGGRNLLGALQSLVHDD